MLLAIDIGNTNVTLGVFGLPWKQEKLLPKPLANWRLSSEAHSTCDEYAIKILTLFALQKIVAAEVKKVVIASVVPSMTGTFVEFAQKYFGLTARVVGENLAVGLPILCEQPQEVGADRLVNAFAARWLVKSACVIVDFGTATTLDCLSKEGEYLGGMIVPGPMVSAEALARRTAKLPKISWVKPRRVIGKNTVESIQSGLYYGYISLVDGLIEKVRGELGDSCVVLATGGASTVAQDSRYIQTNNVFSDLTLQGLFLLDNFSE